MMQLLFKLKRRVELLLKETGCRFRIYEWKSLYGSRLLIGKGFRFGKSFSLVFELSPTSDATCRIANNIIVRNHVFIRIGENGQLKIGNNCFLNNGCSITCFGTTEIGENCQIGEGVKFYDHNHLYKDRTRRINEQGYNVGSIRIGNNCWIGSNVLILKDVEIGDNVVIGAGCVIHASVPSNTVVINKQEQVLKSY